MNHELSKAVAVRVMSPWVYMVSLRIEIDRSVDVPRDGDRCTTLTWRLEIALLIELVNSRVDYAQIRLTRFAVWNGTY